MEPENNIKHIYHPKPAVILIRKIAFIFSLAVMATAILVGAYYTRKNASQSFSFSPKDSGIARFNSPEQMQAYLNQTRSTGFGGLEMQPMARDLARESSKDGFSNIALDETGTSQRASQTNVQVLGIDEPDIVKTDGKYIYLAGEPRFYIMGDAPIIREGLIPAPDLYPQNTQIINAFPPDGMEKIAEIEDESSELLLKENVLVAINKQNSTITAYDVADKENPTQKWRALFSDAYFVSLRLLENDILVVSQKGVNYEAPCPIPLLEMGGKRTSIACDNIYHLTNLNPSQTTYTALKINIQTGEISDTVTFLGSEQNTTVYVSNSATYVVLSSYLNQNTLMLEYFINEPQNVLPDEIIAKIKKMAGYDLSLEAKLIELQVIIQNYKNTLEADQARELDTNITNALADYINKNLRSLHLSEIVKIANENMEIISTANIPGAPLNQFSLDEFNGNLRIATTVGQSFLPGVETFNDLYILNNNLDIIGQLTDLGKDERLYSVRFLNDQAYLVTFKDIDPFFVLDLKDPENPILKGELKIPGFSSYLHPLADNLILGVGKEDQYVKLSLFDTSSPQNPAEIDHLLLDEFYSEIIDNHHAFLLDRDNQLFFIPASMGGYIVSYNNQGLELKHAFNENGVKRGLYIDKYFYLISSQKLRAFDINNWEEINELIINQGGDFYDEKS